MKHIYLEKTKFARDYEFWTEMNITNIVRSLYSARIREIDRYANHAEFIQLDVLSRLIRKAEQTEWGKKNNFSKIKDYETFNRLPIQNYEDIKQDVDRMRHGEKNILWPGKVKWYAKSSGTTNDKSKFIPVTREGLHGIHYAGGTDTVILYLRQCPDSKFFSGKGLILGGSHAPNYNVKDSLVGDLSAIMIENVNPVINYFRTPSKKVALLSDFEEKMEKIARYSIKENVTNLSGVPSWMLAVLKRVMEIKGVDNLAEVWPNLEIFFHGGVAFTPYHEQYNQIIRSDKMKYMETYNASEGFFGIQNELDDPSMLLMIDYDIFYEFIPMDEFESEHPTVVPLWDVELNKNYAMLISSSCGLWRYVIGDTLKFTSKDPYKFIISGRTKHYINAFGEELMVDNAEKGLEKACAETGAQVLEYTAAPVFMDKAAKCRHQWVIEFAENPDSIEHFASVLDKALQEINSDYEAKRRKNITLQPLEVVPARKDLFHDWLKSAGKLGGQHKVPRLSNNRDYIDQILAMNN